MNWSGGTSEELSSRRNMQTNIMTYSKRMKKRALPSQLWVPRWGINVKSPRHPTAEMCERRTIFCSMIDCHVTLTASYTDRRRRQVRKLSMNKGNNPVWEYFVRVFLLLRLNRGGKFLSSDRYEVKLTRL